LALLPRVLALLRSASASLLPADSACSRRGLYRLRSRPYDVACALCLIPFSRRCAPRRGPLSGMISRGWARVVRRVKPRGRILLCRRSVLRSLGAFCLCRPGQVLRACFCTGRVARGRSLGSVSVMRAACALVCSGWRAARITLPPSRPVHVVAWHFPSLLVRPCSRACTSRTGASVECEARCSALLAFSVRCLPHVSALAPCPPRCASYSRSSIWCCLPAVSAVRLTATAASPPLCVRRRAALACRDLNVAGRVPRPLAGVRLSPVDLPDVSLSRSLRRAFLVQWGDFRSFLAHLIPYVLSDSVCTVTLVGTSPRLAPLKPSV